MAVIDKALIALALAEAAVFCLFWFDKVQARTHGQRIPERMLLLAAACGGLGAWLGQHGLRHKTRKEPFRTWLGLALGLHAIGVAVLFVTLLV